MKKNLITSPILVVLYNRPNKTEQILKILSKIKFKKLYLKLDGPKNYHDKIKIDKCYKHLINFKKKQKGFIKVIKEKKNLGLQKNILKSIDYVLRKNNQIIVLEDDHLPSPSFFSFCEKMLNYYKNEKKIKQISGTCYLPKNKAKDDYFFSKMPDCVGWATWKRAWIELKKEYVLYDLIKKKKIEKYYKQKDIVSWFHEYLFREYYVQKNKGLWSTWWHLTMILTNGLSINPMKNLVFHDGLDRKDNPIHFNESYEIRKKFLSSNLNINKLNKKLARHDTRLDQSNIDIIKKTDPIFKTFNQIKRKIRFYFILEKLKNKKVKITF